MEKWSGVDGGVSFFSNSDNKLLIDNLGDRLSEHLIKVSNEGGKDFFVLFVCETLRCMGSLPLKFDDRCGFNIEDSGVRFLELLRLFNIQNSDLIQELFSICYRFAIEYQASSPDALPEKLQGLVIQVSINEKLFNNQTQLSVRFAEHQMLILVLKRYVYHPGLENVRDLKLLLQSVVEQKKRTEEDLTVRQEKVDLLKDSLDKYRDAFNFFGLYDGFKNLRTQKGREGFVGLVLLSALGLLMMIPFFVKFYLTFNPVKDVSLDGEFYIGLIGFELVLAYFFRVALHNFRSVKTQLLQIDLRMTLCQFIQDYARYAKEVRNGSPELLERFDQIIFSGIVNNDGSIPSTFDGLEQLGGLIDKVRGK
ncbi:hypothetical protein [Pseudomonas sp. H1_D04]